MVSSNPTSHRHLEQLAPMNAGMGSQTTVDLHSLPLSPWAGLGDSHDELPVVAFT
jgi:ABC-2 type transport system permease protein